jgi:hypothetical protein
MAPAHRNVLLSLPLLALVVGCALEVSALGPASFSSADGSVEPAASADSGPPDAGPNAPDAAPVPTRQRAYLVAADELHFSVLDLEDPGAPRLLGPSGDGSEDDEPLPLHALASDDMGHLYAGRHGGLEVYRVSEGGVDFEGAFWIETTQVLDVAARRGLAFIALGAGGLQILDVADPRRVSIVGFISAELSIHDVALLDADHVAIYDGRDPAVSIYDIRDPSAPRRIAGDLTDFVTSRSSGLAAAGGFIALNAVYGRDGSGLWFFDTRALPSFGSLGFHRTARAARGGPVALWPTEGGVFGYFSDREGGVVIAEARTDRAEARAGHLAPAAFDVVTHRAHLYVAEGEAGLGVYRLRAESPQTPERTTSIALPGTALRLSVCEVIDTRP